MMVGKTAFYLVVSLFVIFCIGSVGAEPDLIVISSDKSDTGIIANQHDTATITVILSSGSIPVGNVQVNFTVVNPSMGTLNPITAFTDENGRASTIFTTGVESGIAEIRADSGSLINTTPQLIIAPVPDDTSFIKSPVEWLIANGSDSATITVYAFNSSPSFSNYPLPGLQVDFGVNNTIFGGFDPVTAITDSNGIARSTFTTKTKSGTALFYGNITYNVSNVQHLVPIEQKIDHDIPHHISEYNYSYRADAGEIVPLSFKFSDTWGNPVDNRRIAEEVNLTVSSYSSLPEGAGFVNGSDYVRSRIVPVDAEGYVRIDLKTDQVPGDNTVTIHPMIYDSSGYQTINTKSLTILGIPGKPVRIEANFIPPDFRLPADGSSVFKIVYTLWDKYDNCVHNRSVMVETSIPGEGKIVGTNPQGEIWLEYGPKWSIGKIDITATALDNASVTHTQQVFFVPQEPADVLFTVSPQTMPSREVPNRDSTWLIATVVDENGNPVSESVEVTFGFSGVTYEKQVTSDPEIPVPTAMTDEYGIAMVEFLPGEFDASNQTPATGRCDVSASWGGVTRTVPVVWKNYPYLSVEANASANLVQVNDTIDIMVLLKGDGYKLQPPPIDVILCTDRSGSMLYDNPDRMHSVREAAKVFVDEFSASRDRIGIVTFGRNGYIRRPGYNSGIPESEIHNVYDPYSGTYDGYATYDRVLTNDFIDVKTKLDRILPDHGTPMREAVRLSISTLTKNGRANALKAVVLLSDGDYNWYGDPLARGTGSSGSPTDYTDLTTNYCTFDDLGSWSARYGHTSVVMPDGSIVLMGGYDGSNKRDVWRSTDNGETWTRMTSSAGWSARQYHTSVVMPDGSIVLMGGNDGSRKNDVWRSTDNGATWTRMTSSAGWSARQYHTSVVMPDGSIVLMGGNDGRRKNDVWRSTDNGKTWTQVIIISTGQSSNQNMSVYANNNNIKIYSIAFADDMTEGGKQTLQTLALGTGGKYYEASATDIEDIYRAIAGDLKIEAGVNTSMDLDYQKIIVNYTTEEVNDPLNPIFEYNYSYGNSTWINSYFTDNTPIDIPGLPWNFDNTSEWTDTRKLSFSLGTVHLHQVWEIRYRLIARQEGFFNLFGPQSSVTFEDADEPLTLPDLILKVNPELSDTPIKNVELYYIQTEQNRSADNSAFYVTFDLSHEYTGKNNLSEKYYIVTSDQQRHYLGYTNLTPNQTREQRQYTILSRRLPLGSIALELILTEYDKPDPLQARGEIIVFLELENPDLSKRPWYFLLT